MYFLYEIGEKIPHKKQQHLLNYITYLRSVLLTCNKHTENYFEHNYWPNPLVSVFLFCVFMNRSKYGYFGNMFKNSPFVNSVFISNGEMLLKVIDNHY